MCSLNKQSASTLHPPLFLILSLSLSLQAYRSTPDHLIPLTDKGHFQARGAGERLKALLDKDGQTGGKVKFFCSPHLRTKQTLEGVSDL